MAQNENTILWRAEIAGIGENTWSSNGTLYGTATEAKNWLDALAGRWYGYDMSRIVPDIKPKREPVDFSDRAIYQNFRSDEQEPEEKYYKAVTTWDERHAESDNDGQDEY